MANQHDVEIIHARINEVKDCIGDVKESVAELTTEVRTSIALCGTCRPQVLGNGSEGFGVRLARLESNKTSAAWWITKSLAALTIIATVVATAASVAMHWVDKGRQTVESSVEPHETPTLR
jgi:hypothetical protein